MRKLISTIAASAMALSALTAISASAANAPQNNGFDVATEVLSSAVTASDGTVIPAGTTAITVSISGNTGFSSVMTKLDIASADVIVGEDGSPVVDAGEALGDSLISGAECNGIVAFAAASADENTADGDVFTFYADNVDSVSIIDNETAEQISSVETGIIPMSSNAGYYVCGDVDNNDSVDSVDASAVLTALKKSSRPSLAYNTVNVYPKYYFPAISTAKAAFIWTHPDNLEDFNNKDAVVNERTATEILSYYSAHQVGSYYEGESEYLGLIFPM